MAQAQIQVPVSVSLTPNVKPGIQTTEFWTTLLTHLVAGLVLLYTIVLHRSFVDQQAINALIPIAATVAAGITQAVYVVSRGRLKQVAHQAVTQQSLHVVQTVDPILSANVSGALAALQSVASTVAALQAPAAAPSTVLGGTVAPVANEGSAEAGAPSPGA